MGFCNNTSVGLIVYKGKDILLIERKKFPFGIAPVAGHVDDGEEFIEAASRELKEEVGLVSTRMKLVLEKRYENECRRENGSWHYWNVYECSVKDSKINRSLNETKSTDWYSSFQLKTLIKRTEDYINKKITDVEWKENPGLEIVWYDIFKDIKLV